MTLSTISEKDDGTDVAVESSSLIVVGDGGEHDVIATPKRMTNPVTATARAINSFKRPK